MEYIPRLSCYVFAEGCHASTAHLSPYHDSEIEGRRDNPATRCCDEHPYAFPPRAADMERTIIVPVV